MLWTALVPVGLSVPLGDFAEHFTDCRVRVTVIR